MIYTPKTRKQIKVALIIANIVLSAVLLTLIILGVLVISPSRIEQAALLNQYKLFDMNNLPDPIDTIEAEYLKANNSTAAIPVSNEEGANAHKERVISNPSSAKLAIIITHLGLNKHNTELALTLPKQFSLGFLPYTASLKPLLHQAQEKGHEIYLYIPFQTDKPIDNPGKYALQTNLSAEENAARLAIILSVHGKYNGVYSSYKEKFTDNKEATEPILDQIAQRNLIFILGKTSNLLSAKYLFEKNNIISPNIIIDAEPDREAIRKNLNQLVEFAKKHKTALGYAGSYALTINMLKEWLPTLKEQGVELVPVSELGEDGQ